MNSYELNCSRHNYCSVGSSIYISSVCTPIGGPAKKHTHTQQTHSIEHANCVCGPRFGAFQCMPQSHAKSHFTITGRRSSTPPSPLGRQRLARTRVFGCVLVLADAQQRRPRECKQITAGAVPCASVLIVWNGIAEVHLQFVVSVTLRSLVKFE